MRIYTFDAHGIIIPHTLKDVQQALAELGHDVFVGPPHPSIVAVIDGIISTCPDMMITIDRVGLFPEYLAVMERPLKIVSWYYDNPINFLNATADDFHWINDLYHIFSWDREYLPALRQAGYGHTFFLPFATNPSIYKSSDDTTYKYDVSFVASYNDMRGELIRKIAERGIVIDVFGDDGWLKQRHPNVRFHGSADNRDECPAIYAASKVNLNITNAQLLTALPVRIFDVMASGGFVLTDFREDATSLFVSDRELKIYHDHDEMVSLIQYFLEHQAERELIAENGCKRVHSEYTFNQQLDKMLRMIDDEAEKKVVPTGMPVEKIFNALLMTGLSYLKFDFLSQARERLLEAMKIKVDHKSLLAITMLAARTEQREAVKDCLEQLKAICDVGSEFEEHIKACVDKKEIPNCWPVVYKGIYNGAIQKDGTVPGWKPACLSDQNL